MDDQNVLPPAAQNVNDSDVVELESLGLALFDVDMDLAECFKDCPEWNDPILDTSVLDELKDCLSDDLWSSPDMGFGSVVDFGSHNNGPTAGPSCLATPPLSPDSVPSPAPSLASSVSTISTDLASPQKVPSPWSGTQAQTGGLPVPSPVAGLYQPAGSTTLSGMAAAAAVSSESAVPTTALQVLKSGEVVCVQVAPGHLGAQQSTGIHVGTSLSGQTTASGQPSPPPLWSGALPGRKTAGTRKRQHPDSAAAVDPISGEMDQLSKKHQRLIKNREAASVSRQKKKEYVQTLEGRLREAALKNNTLLRENESLRKQLVQLESENKLLRVSLSQPGSSLSSLQRPALVMVLCLCFVSLLFLPKYTNLSLSSPATSTALSVTPSHVTGRALLAISEHSLDTQPENQEFTKTRPSSRLLQPPHPPHTASSTSALVPVSTAVSSLKTLDQRVQELRRLHEALPCPPSPSSACTCPTLSKTNSTILRMRSEEVTNCFKWYEENYPKWLHHSQEKTPENSLAVVVNSNNEPVLSDSVDYHIAELYDMPLLYKSFKKYFTRKLDNFYLISFKDHLLLNAPLHNSTTPPQLSVVIPTQGYSVDSFPMLQIDCEILNTNIIHMPRAAV